MDTNELWTRMVSGYLKCQMYATSKYIVFINWIFFFKFTERHYWFDYREQRAQIAIAGNGATSTSSWWYAFLW